MTNTDQSRADQSTDQGTRPALPVETMTVTVRDVSRESPWGSGMINPRTRTVTISAFCPVSGCGERRGTPYGRNSCDDGAWYWVERWDNPCGHLDLYENVVREADELEKLLAAAQADGPADAGGEG